MTKPNPLSSGSCSAKCRLLHQRDGDGRHILGCCGGGCLVTIGEFLHVLIQVPFKLFYIDRAITRLLIGLACEPFNERFCKRTMFPFGSFYGELPASGGRKDDRPTGRVGQFGGEFIDIDLRAILAFRPLKSNRLPEQQVSKKNKALPLLPIVVRVSFKMRPRTPVDFSRSRLAL